MSWLIPSALTILFFVVATVKAEETVCAVFLDLAYFLIAALASLVAWSVWGILR